MLKILRCLVSSFKTQQNLCSIKRSTYCTTVKETDVCDIYSYLSQHQEQILKVVNENVPLELAKYDITLARARNVASYRVQNGPYKTVLDLLLVKGMAPKYIERFCISILQDNKKDVKRYTQKRYRLITPDLSYDIEKTTNTVLGIHIGFDTTSWAQLNVKNEVINWDFYKFPNHPYSPSIYNMVRQATEIVQLLPQSDVYVMEEGNPPKSTKRKKDAAAFFRHQQLAVALLACLGSRNGSSILHNNLYTLRYQTTAQFFGLVIGAEIVSTQTIMQQLVDSDRILDHTSKLPNVYVNESVKNKYVEQCLITQDEMNWSLLRALTFIELGIHKNFLSLDD